MLKSLGVDANILKMNKLKDADECLIEVHRFTAALFKIPFSHDLVMKAKY